MDPMLEAPRELADRALVPLNPLELPPKPPALDPLLDGMLRLPIWSLPPRFAAEPADPRLAALGPVLADRLEAPALPAERSVPPALPVRVPAPPAALLETPALPVLLPKPPWS